MNNGCLQNATYEHQPLLEEPQEASNAITNRESESPVIEPREVTPIELLFLYSKLC